MLTHIYCTLHTHTHTHTHTQTCRVCFTLKLHHSISLTFLFSVTVYFASPSMWITAKCITLTEPFIIRKWLSLVNFLFMRMMFYSCRCACVFEEFTSLRMLEGLFFHHNNKELRFQRKQVAVRFQIWTSNGIYTHVKNMHKTFWNFVVFNS